MGGYILKRLSIGIPTLLIIVTASFFLMRAAPGGPFDAEVDLDPLVRANLEASYGLDQPIGTQYLRFLDGLTHFDFGPSTTYPDRSVGELIADGLPVTLKLGLTAMLLATIIGLLAGVIAARNRNGVLDGAIMMLASVGIAVPNFVVAPILTLLFGITLQLLPVAGWGDGSLRYWLLPVVALALPQIAAIARITRSSMLETLSADYVRTARAKGMPERRVLWRHVMRSAFLPVMSYLGPVAANVVTGSVIVEQIFSLPGIGRFFVQGAINRDYGLVMGIVILYATVLILLNLLVDIAYGWLDPRARVK
ncbi:ABC transporter permease subunit [Sphingopyxis panaciterrulae]|uniref:Oligopeptide transport system permease protein n=1 Tax=Sphingopyxis panaciterrulae TaxID=462372 RepID=A0A7W9ESD5_9SPHN|nr:oligopeptide transport system permease protein [Sphingopyxis panaciterrulae]